MSIGEAKEMFGLMPNDPITKKGLELIMSGLEKQRKTWSLPACEIARIDREIAACKILMGEAR